MIAAHMGSRVCLVSGHALRKANLTKITATTLPTRGFASLNVNDALKKQEEDKHFGDLLGQPVTILQGIGPKHAEELETLGLKTVDQLADYKFYHLARALLILSKVEEADSRGSAAKMNVNKGLDKAYEDLPLSEIVNLPVHALQGITESKGSLWASLGVKTVADLGQCKYCEWAEAFRVAARFEEPMDD